MLGSIMVWCYIMRQISPHNSKWTHSYASQQRYGWMIIKDFMTKLLKSVLVKKKKSLAAMRSDKEKAVRKKSNICWETTRKKTSKKEATEIFIKEKQLLYKWTPPREHVLTSGFIWPLGPGHFPVSSLPLLQIYPFLNIQDKSPCFFSTFDSYSLSSIRFAYTLK